MKTRLENIIDPLGQDPTKDKTESSHWEPSQQKILLPVDRPRSNYRSLGKAVDRRGSQSESETLCRSTGPVDQTKQKALLLQPVDRDSWPKCTFALGACRSTARSTDIAVLLCQRSTARSTGWGPKQVFGYLFEVNIFLTNFLLMK